MTVSATPPRSALGPAIDEEYLGLAGDGDEYGAMELVHGLLDAGVPAQRVIVDLIARTQLRVGELWAADEWSIAREHAATAVSERALATVAARTRTRPARGRVTIACVDGEWHGLPARILGELLRLDGWRVDFLGANVPGPHLVSHLHQTGPDAVALSCMISTRLPRAHAAIAACRTAGVPVITGGRGFGPGGRYALRLGADAWAADGEAAVARLAVNWPPTGVRDPVDDPHGSFGSLGDEEYTHVVRNRPVLIQTALRRLAETYPDVRDYDQRQADSTAEDIGHIVDFTAASLYVGDRQVFTDFTRWTADVLAARGVPAAALRAGLLLVREQLTDFPAAVATLDAGLDALRH